LGKVENKQSTMKNVLYITLSLLSLSAFAQSKAEKEAQKAIANSKKYTYEGNTALKGDKPVQAEVEYRKAIAEDKNNATAQYNLGTMYYQQKSYDEAFSRLKNASTSDKITEEEKHKAFHNLGNAFMKNKEYEKAVLSYKEALRHNPKDEETRYNLAVAKEMLKQNPPPPQNNKNNKDKNNQQNQNNQNNQQNQNNQNKNQDNKNNQDNKDNKDNKKDQGDKQDKNKDKGDDQKDPNQNNQQNKNQSGQGQGEQRPSSLSPQQMERILEAMNNEERKTQEKINAQKVKGQRAKTEKDW